jgi:hypothetical protein
MIDGPISQDTEYVENSTGEIFTVLSGNDDEGTPTETVLRVLGTELPAVVYYSTSDVTKTIIVSETSFRQDFSPSAVP